MMNDINEKLISRIIELEFEITTEILSGHKPFIGDHLETKRSEVNTLRCLLYGSESIFCKKIVGEKK
jgi:hypothetical protein